MFDECQLADFEKLSERMLSSIHKNQQHDCSETEYQFDDEAVYEVFHELNYCLRLSNGGAGLFKAQILTKADIAIEGAGKTNLEV